MSDLLGRPIVILPHKDPPGCLLRLFDMLVTAAWRALWLGVAFGIGYMVGSLSS